MFDLNNEILLYYAVRNYLIFQNHLLNYNVYNISNKLIQVFGCIIPIPIISLAINEAKEILQI